MHYHVNYNFVWKYFDKLSWGLVLSIELAVVGILFGILIGQLPWLALVVAITAPHAIEEVRLVSEGPDPERHNRAMALSGQLQFEFGAALVAALLIRRLI